MGAVCGICMALSVIAEEFISCAHRIRMKLIESLFKF